MDEPQPASSHKQARPFGLQFAEKLPMDKPVFQMGEPTIPQELASALGLEYDDSVGYTVVTKVGDRVPFVTFLRSYLALADLVITSAQKGHSEATRIGNSHSRNGQS